LTIGQAYSQQENPPSSERGCYIRTMIERVQLKKNSGLEPQGSLHQDELIGGEITLIPTLCRQWRFAAMRSEKVVAEAGNSSETQRKGNVCRWKPLSSNS
jgi:hypothetical protein